jgi:hypothetical protein
VTSGCTEEGEYGRYRLWGAVGKSIMINPRSCLKLHFYKPYNICVTYTYATVCRLGLNEFHCRSHARPLRDMVGPRA